MGMKKWEEYMNNNNNNNNKMAKVMQFKPLLALCKLIWTGTVEASIEDKQVRFAYLALAIITLFVGFVAGAWGFMFLIILGVAIGFGIKHRLKGAPLTKRQKFFDNIFYTMGFYAKGDIYPNYITETEISEYKKGFAFDSLIPVSSWIARQEELAVRFGYKIIDIKQHPEDNRVVHVFIETKPLPNYAEWRDDFLAKGNLLTIGLIHSGFIGMILASHPHAFIAGETGSGKSNILKCFIHQALAKNYDVVLIDFKRGVSFANFADRITIYYEYPEVVTILKGMVEETKNRLDRFREAGVDNIGDYNQMIESRSGSAAPSHHSTHTLNPTTNPSVSDGSGYMKRKIIFIDELAELLKTRDKETANALNDSIETLTRLSRAVGIHLIMGLQRPDSTIVSGQIKNNVSFRVCGRFVDKEPSRIMLGSDTASSLPNVKGRFIVKDDNLYEVQAFYFKDTKPVVAHKPTAETPEMPATAPPPTPKEAAEATRSPTVQDVAKNINRDGYAKEEAAAEPSQALTPTITAPQPPTPADIGNADTAEKPETPKDGEITFDFSSFKK